MNNIKQVRFLNSILLPGHKDPEVKWCDQDKDLQIEQDDKGITLIWKLGSTFVPVHQIGQVIYHPQEKLPPLPKPVFQVKGKVGRPKK